jgi:HEAT repeat protein
VIEQALAELQSPDEKVRGRAVRRLRVIGGPQAVAAIIGALNDPSGHVRAMAGVALQRLRPPEAVPILIERLRSDASGGGRAFYADVLDSIGDPAAVEPLIEALQDADERVVQAACWSLMTSDDPRAIEPLLRTLEHPVWRVRYEALSALVELGCDDERLHEALTKLGQEPEAEKYLLQLERLTRELAERGRAAGGEEESAPATAPDEQMAFATATEELRSADPEVRSRGTHRLRSLGGPEAVAALISALEDPAIRVRSAAALALGALEAPEAVPALVDHLLYDTSPHVRLMCAAFLHRFHDERTVEPLMTCLADTDTRMLTSATIGLGVIGDARAIPVILPLVDHPLWSVRHHACWSLVELKAAEPRLVAALEKLAQSPEAEEHDLAVDEDWLDMKELAEEEGEPPPTRRPKIGELLEQARRLIDQEQA